MQIPNPLHFARKALVTSLLPLVAGGAQAQVGGYGGYAGHRRGQIDPFANSREVVVIDSRVEGYEALLKAIPGHMETVILSGKGDGVEEMAQVLAGRANIESLHIFSHGDAGRVFLGDGVLSNDSLQRHSKELEPISRAMAPGGDILLYGCRVAGTTDGREFIEKLALVTGADVAASDDLSGAAVESGDWELEVASGSIDGRAISSLALADFSGVLLPTGTITMDGFSDPPGTLTPTDGDFTLSANFQGSSANVDLYNGAPVVAYVNTGSTDPNANGAFWFAVEANSAIQSFQLTGIDFGEYVNSNLTSFEIRGYDTSGALAASSTIPHSSALDDPFNIDLTSFQNVDIKKFVLAGTVADNYYLDNLELRTFSVSNVVASNNPPAFMSAGPFSVDETSAANAAVGDVDAHDGENSGTDVNVTYSIVSGNPNGDGDGTPAFAVDANSGAIIVSDPDDIDYEASSGHSLTIRATDDQGATTDQAVSIGVNDIAPAIAPGQAFIARESAAASSSLGTVATTGDKATSFSIVSGNGSGAFSIISTTGELVLADPSVLDASVIPAYTLTIRASDGTTAQDGDVTVNVTDDVAPLVTGAAPVNASAGDSAVDFSVSFDEPVTGVSVNDFALTATGSASGVVSTVTGSGAAYTVSVTGIAGEGSLRLDLNAGTDIDDGSGNAPAAYTSGTVHTVDRVSPVVSTVSVPADGTYGAGDILTITANFSESVSVDTTGGTPSIPVTLDTGGAVDAVYVSGSGTTALLFSYAIQSGQADSDGISVGGSMVTNGGTLRDAAGNDAELTLNAVASTTGVLVDAAAPDAPVISGITTDTGTPGDAITSDQTLLFSGTAEASSTVELFVDGASIGSTTADISGNWSLNHASSLSDGSHAVTAKATDAGGNTSGASAVLNLVIDTAAPSAPAAPHLDPAKDTGTSTSDGITSESAISLVGSAEANSTVEVILDGGSIGSTTADAGGNWTLAHNLTAEGNYAVTVKASDAAGNTSAASASLSLTLDTTAPAAPTVSGISPDSGAAGDGTTDTGALTFSGGAEANSTVEVRVDGSAVGTTTADGSGLWSFDHTGTTLAEGEHSVTATAVDAAGNRSGASAAYTVTVDTAAPAAPSQPQLDPADDSGLSNQDGITAIATPTFSGSAEPGATVTLYSDTAGKIGSATADAASGTWSVATTALGEGAHSITAEATDTAGNLSARSVARSVTIDSTAPAVAAGQSLTVSEAAAIGDVVGTVNATDLNPVSDWAITAGNDGSVFAIDSAGVITLNGTVDYETQSSYGLTVAATDEAGNTAAGSVTVNIGDAPVSIPAGQSFTVDEDAADGTVIGQVVTSGDAASAFTIDGSAFAIDNSGTISVASATDISYGASFEPLVSVDAGTASERVTITVTNDRDGDGLPNDWERANGLDPDDPADASDDLDGDGLSNLEEYQANSDPASDDQAPVVTAPAAVIVEAVGLFTEVALGEATASDGKDGAVPASSDAPERFSPGRHTVTWSATDTAGNTGSATQQVDVLPLAGVAPGQLTGEGSPVTVKVTLNGPAPAYPVTIPYTVAGTADGTDHLLSDGTLTIHQGLEGVIAFTTAADGLTGEPDETVEISLGQPVGAALGRPTLHTVTIREGNLAPVVGLTATQAGLEVSTVAGDAGPVVLSAVVGDPNGADTHTFDWSGSDGRLVDTDAASDTLTFDPASLAPGLYRIELRVSDDSDVSPESARASRTLRVVETAPVLTAADSDGDGVDDLTEGWGDADTSGIVDYLDALKPVSVLPERAGNTTAYLIESPPGTSLALGPLAMAAGSEQAGIATGSLAADDGTINSGGLFDFRVGRVGDGGSVAVVVPQAAAVADGALYRVWVGDGWMDFAENGSNGLASAPGAPGYCPPPGDPAYAPGMTAGHWCVELTVEDGGPNDGDGRIDGHVGLSGGVATPAGDNPRSPSAPKDPFEGGGALGGWALLGLLPLYLRRRRR